MSQHITWETKLMPWNKGQKQEKLIKYGVDNVHEHLLDARKCVVKYETQE